MLSRLGQVLCWATFVLVLTGCSYKTKWRDTTGQGRAQEQAQVAARECSDASGYTTLNASSTKADFEAFKAKMDSCMVAQGWELVRDNSSNSAT